MSESAEANNTDVYDDGNPRTGVVVSASPTSRWVKPSVVIGIVVTSLLAMFSMAIMVAYLAPSVERLTENGERAANERDELLTQIEELQSEQLDERSVDDCVALYLYDIEVAKGVAQVTLGDSLATAVLFDGSDNAALAQAIFDADTELREALEALREYQEIDPPPDECPHPRA